MATGPQLKSSVCNFICLYVYVYVTAYFIHFLPRYPHSTRTPPAPGFESSRFNLPWYEGRGKLLPTGFESSRFNLPWYEGRGKLLPTGFESSRFNLPWYEGREERKKAYTFYFITRKK
jgi:hypothetical protein